MSQEKEHLNGEKNRKDQLSVTATQYFFPEIFLTLSKKYFLCVVKPTVVAYISFLFPLTCNTLSRTWLVLHSVTPFRKPSWTFPLLCDAGIT